MKKTKCIQLVLITAALAGCDRPLYQQGPAHAGPYDGPYVQDPNAQRPYDPAVDRPDSSNSCPLDQSALPPDYYLWQSGLQPFDFYYDGPFRLFGYYAYRFPALVVRAGFGRVGLGKSGFGRFGGGGHS
jgi:hypothetical protein